MSIWRRGQPIESHVQCSNNRGGFLCGGLHTYIDTAFHLVVVARCIKSTGIWTSSTWCSEAAYRFNARLLDIGFKSHCGCWNTQFTYMPTKALFWAGSSRNIARIWWILMWRLLYATVCSWKGYNIIMSMNGAYISAVVKRLLIIQLEL